MLIAIHEVLELGAAFGQVALEQRIAPPSRTLAARPSGQDDTKVEWRLG